MAALQPLCAPNPDLASWACRQSLSLPGGNHHRQSTGSRSARAGSIGPICSASSTMTPLGPRT